MQPPSNVDYLITCSPNLKLFTTSPPSKTLSWKQCKWQHILEKVSFREKSQLKQTQVHKRSRFCSCPHTITSGNIIIDFPSPWLTSAFTNPSPPAAAVICGQPLKGLILLKIAGWLAPMLQNVRLSIIDILDLYKRYGIVHYVLGYV